MWKSSDEPKVSDQGEDGDSYFQGPQDHQGRIQLDAMMES